MKVRLLRENALRNLRNAVPANLEQYRNGTFQHLFVDPGFSFETDIVIDESAVAQLKNPVGEKLFDSENCQMMFSKCLPALTPYQAADERLWTMLTHTLLLDHARARWPIPKKNEEAVKYIRSHYFASTQRQLERENVGSRLWWMGHLCSRVPGVALKDALDVFLYRADVRANIIERPTTAQSVPVFTAILRKLADSYKGQKKLFHRDNFRPMMVRLNGLGGYKLLDALDAKAVEAFINKIVADELKLSKL
jgi:hypothetical protein